MVQCMKYCGGMFSGYKAILCAVEIIAVGHWCTFEGQLPEDSRVEKIINWGPCGNLTDVHTFLGTIGVAHIFIHNFFHCAHHLTLLTCKGQPFVFGLEQLAVQEDLKQALLNSPALHPIDYNLPSPVIMSVNTSYLAVGFYLCQCNANNPKK